MSDKYNKPLLKLKQGYPETRVDMQTSGTGAPYINATCSITDNASIHGNGKYVCEDSYYGNPEIA